MAKRSTTLAHWRRVGLILSATGAHVGCGNSAANSAATESMAPSSALAGTLRSEDPPAEHTMAPALAVNISAGGAGAAAAPVSLRCEADAAAAQNTDYSKPGPLQVATLDVSFADVSRPIAQTSTHAAAPARQLPATIYYPTTTRALPGPARLANGGPFPLIMYSHGYSSTRAEGEAVGNRMASYGYIVVAPDFPLSNLLANGGAPDAGDVVNQPGDVSFLIDRVIELSRNPRHVLANGVDPRRIGATGCSMGGLTTLLAAFHPKLQDPRIVVAAPIAPLSSFLLEGFFYTRDVPLMLMSGDLDAFIDYTTNSRRSFELARSKAHLVTLAKGSHAAFASPFDPDTVAALNSLIGKPGAHPSNPDGFGCGAVSDDLNAAPNFIGSLGGPEEFIQLDPQSPLAPCTGDEYKQPARDAVEQVATSTAAITAFMEAHLASDDGRRRDACRYLLHEVPKIPGVTVE